MTAATAILAGLALQAAQGAGPGSIRGVVRDAAEGQPVAGAIVTLVPEDFSVLTDSTGAYQFSAVAPGERRLRASRLDFSALEVRLLVPEGGTVQVDFHLSLRPVAMPTVEAIAAAEWDPDSLASDPGTTAVSTAVVRLLDSTPGVAEAGIAEVARQFLGPDPPAPDNVLFVRGAGASLDMVLLDGAPVQAPFHLGGLVQPSVAPSVVSADRLQGGVSPRWDGGLSDVLLLESRPGAGRPARAALYADMLSAGAIVEGGAPGRTSWLVSVRDLHGVAAEPFVEGAFPESYSDALGRLDIVAGTGDTVVISGFWNRETVYLDPEDPEPDPPEWGNRAGAIRFRGTTPLGKTELGAGYGEFRTRLPIGRTMLLTADGLNRRARLTADVDTRLGPGRLGYGAHMDRLDLRTRFRTDLAASDSVPVRMFRQRSDATALSAWLGLTWPVSRTLRLSAGLRATTFSGELGNGLSPRLRADLLLSDELVLSLSGGRFQQLLVTADPDGAGGASFITSTDGDPVSLAFTEIVRGSADHVVVSLAHMPSPGREVRIEGYWKRATGLPDLPGADLRSAGLDVWLRQRFGAFDVWGTYSLGWGWSDVDVGPDVELFAGRHFLRGGVTRDFASEGLRLDAEVSYGAGLEFGSIPRTDRPVPLDVATGMGSGRAPSGIEPSFSMSGSGPSLAQAPDGSYLRLNVQATGRLRVRIFGRQQLLFPYFRIVNALDRNDALFYRFDGAEDGKPRAVGAVPILPVLGVEWHM
jgi:hypothetical protein